MNCNRIINDCSCNIIVQNDPYDVNYVNVYILQWNPTDLSKVTSQTKIRESEKESIIFTIGKDGFYTLCTVPIPLDSSKPYYYKDGKFYKGDQEVTLQEVLESDDVEPSYEYYFQTCWLRRCYIKYAKEIIDSRNVSICSADGIDSNISYKRDLVWSALNVINYMIELDQYEEAQRLLERIQGCNGLCESSETSTSSCGCGR